MVTAGLLISFETGDESVEKATLSRQKETRSPAPPPFPRSLQPVSDKVGRPPDHVLRLANPAIILGHRASPHCMREGSMSQYMREWIVMTETSSEWAQSNFRPLQKQLNLRSRLPLTCFS